MSEFIRARSGAQKDLRMAEIKHAADSLFSKKPYHEITLTNIAEQLSWSRANLYKYVTTKEEIFLELCEDKRTLYFDALKAAFPIGCGYSLEVWAEVWAGILKAHESYLHYSDILPTIIETNVSVERLAIFKTNYYKDAGEITDMLHENLQLSKEDAYEMLLSIYYHSVGSGSICRWNPLVEEALKLANINTPKTDFQKDMKKFIYMNLCYYCQPQ